jgi:hypothetical protein
VLSYTATVPDVSVSASVSPAPAAVGYPATGLITLGNYSGVKATKVRAVTTFSTALGLKSFKQVTGPKAKCVAKAVKGGESQTCTWTSLPAHSQATFRASLLPKKGAKTGTIAAAVTIAQQNASLGLANLTVPLAKPWADLQLSGTAPKTAKPGAKFTDVLTVRNAGPAAASKGKLTVTLATGYKVVKAVAPGAKCTTRKSQVTCTIASIRAGHTVRLALALTASKKGASTLLANVSATTPDYVLSNNGLSVSTLIK